MKTVLVVEDEKMIRRGICSMIQRCGVPVETVLECGNGVMALDILREQKVDVMFTDIRMPKMDGIELVERMQEFPERPLTVVISGYDDFSYAIQMMRKGVREYMLKPVEREQLTKIMEKMEKELEEQRCIRERLEKMELRQICYKMLSESSQGDYGVQLEILPETYVVGCLEKTNMEIEREGVIVPGRVGGFHVVIAEPEQMEYIIRDEFEKKYLGISACHSGTEELCMAYQEACAARREAFGSCSHVVRFEDIITWEHREETDREGMEQIAQMLGTDKLGDAVFRLERKVSDVRNKKTDITAFGKDMRMLMDMIQNLYQSVLKENEEFAGLQNIYDYPCITSFAEELLDWCRKFNEKVNREFENYGEKQKIGQALEYIRENFAGDLNMATVSNYVSMNYSMFSNAFKQYTGTNFVNYLKNLRINEAKKLLEETNLRIIDISQKVGYENEKHFMKTFKSLCGVSPTEFRKNLLYRENSDT